MIQLVYRFSSMEKARAIAGELNRMDTGWMYIAVRLPGDEFRIRCAKRVS